MTGQLTQQRVQELELLTSELVHTKNVLIETSIRTYKHKFASMQG